MDTTLRQQLLEQIIALIKRAQPLVDAIGRKDRELCLPSQAAQFWAQVRRQVRRGDRREEHDVLDCLEI